MIHVRTSPDCPQSNGKLERFHGATREECICPKAPLLKEDAERVVWEYVQHYNEVRLHGAIGYVTPEGRLEHRDKEIHNRREQQLQEARKMRKRDRARTRHGQHGQGGSDAFLDHGNDAPLRRRDSQGESGTGAPCGPGKHSERIMPEVRLTDVPGHGTCDKLSNPNQTAPTVLGMAATSSSSRAPGQYIFRRPNV
jgi:hypothetical protein